MNKLNWLVHEPVRLNTMMLLAQSPRSFSELRRTLDVSPGLLEHQAIRLEEVGYVRSSREGLCAKNGQPYSILKLTDDGYEALSTYCQAAESMVRSIRTALTRTASL